MDHFKGTLLVQFLLQIRHENSNIQSIFRMAHGSKNLKGLEKHMVGILLTVIDVMNKM
jgi:hypothetical protein